MRCQKRLTRFPSVDGKKLMVPMVSNLWLIHQDQPKNQENFAGNKLGNVMVMGEFSVVLSGNPRVSYVIDCPFIIFIDISYETWQFIDNCGLAVSTQPSVVPAATSWLRDSRFVEYLKVTIKQLEQTQTEVTSNSD